MKVEIPEKESGFSQGQGEEGAFDSSFRRALAVVFVVDIENGEVEALAVHLHYLHIWVLVGVGDAVELCIEVTRNIKHDPRPEGRRNMLWKKL
jgi:hypothetical protein